MFADQNKILVYTIHQNRIIMKKNAHFTAIIVLTLCSMFVLTQCAKNSTVQPPVSTIPPCSGPGCQTPPTPPTIPLPPRPQYTQVTVTDPTIISLMVSTFNSLAVDLPTLSTAMGLGHTLSASDINFQAPVESYDANNPSIKAITALFTSNSNSSQYSYGFTIYTDGTNYYTPLIVQTAANQFVRYFDLSVGATTTVNNYVTSTPSVDTTGASFISTTTIDGGAPPISSIGKSVGDCGKLVAACIADQYSNHGWSSVFIFIATAYVPAVAAIAAGECAIVKCVLHK